MIDINLLQQQVVVLQNDLKQMQSELNEVLMEMQNTMQSLARMNKIAAETFHSRLTTLENGESQVPPRDPTGGKEL